MKSKFTLLSLLFISVWLRVSAAPMNGTFTVGGASPDFTNLIQAVDSLVARGVNGPVIFNIRPGTYNGQVHIANVAGTSAVNTVTIKSENNDSTSVILTDTSSISTGNSMFHMYGGDYVTVSHVTMYRIGSAPNCSVILMSTNSKYFTVTNCIIKNDNLTGTALEQSLVYFPASGTGDSLFTFTNNVFMNGSFAIYMTGGSAVSHGRLPNFSDNQFVNQNYRTIYLDQIENVTIRNNTFTSTSVNGSHANVYLNNVTGGFDISGNMMTGINSGYSIYLNLCVGTAGTPSLISNNFIQLQGTALSRGIFYQNSQLVNTYYNTIHNTSTSATSAAIYLTGATDSALKFVNNNLVVSGSGLTFYVVGNAAPSIVTSDYNNIYKSSAGNLAYYDTGYATSFASWQAASGHDTNSVSGDPIFNSSTNLHPTSSSVNNLGTPIPGITVDIDGDARSNTTPDIGADEYSPLADNIGAVAFIQPGGIACGDSVTVVAVVIKNFGQSSQTGFDVTAEVSGIAVATLTETYNGSLISNAFDTIVFTTTVNTYAGGTLDIKVYTSLNADQDNNNDTILGSFTFLSHPNAPVVQSPQLVCDNSVVITGTPDTTDVLVWYDQPVGGNLLYVGNTFNPVLTNDTTFYVESHVGSGGTGCLRITEIQPQDIPSDFVELTNLSGIGFDATGWTLLVSDDYADANIMNATVWNLGYFNPGSVQVRTDGADTNSIWANLLWANGNEGWAMLIDSENQVQDFVAWVWDSLTLLNMVVVYDGDSIRPSTVWSGPGLATCASNIFSLQRFGNSDNNDASDWACDSTSYLVLNPGISSVFTNCGIGMCGSVRIPVDVQLIPGINPVNLGVDTVVGNTDSLLLDAGTGYTSYLWSTGDTTQTIWAMQGTYWVQVVGGSNCSYADTININTPVLVSNLNVDDISIYPNPAKNRLFVTGNQSIFENAVFKILDIEGRVLQIKTPGELNNKIEFDLSTLSNGFYFLQINSGNKSGTLKFTINK